VRDPKDVVVSSFHYIRSSVITHANQNLTSLSGVLDAFLSGHLWKKWGDYGTWWQHLNEYSALKDEICLVHYEDLVRNPAETIRTMARYLGVRLNDQQLTALTKFVNFEEIKKNKAMDHSNEFVNGFDFFRNGKVKDWTNYLSEDMCVKIDTSVRKNLKYRKMKFS
jgi:hypothetical protein